MSIEQQATTLPVDFDYNANIVAARREQARAVHNAFAAMVNRIGHLFR